jgi:hypothetical protein
MTEAKKKNVIAYWLGICQEIDKMAKLDEANQKYWKTIFSSMDLKRFTDFMKDIKEGKTCLYVYIPPGKEPPQAKIYEMCDRHKVLIFQHVIMHDDVTGERFVTPDKYPVVRSVCRRLEQYYQKKLSLPSKDTKTDALTGQVVHDDRAAAITHPELASLVFKDVPAALDELMVRGGNPEAYNSEMKAAIEATGEFETKDLTGNSPNRTVLATEVFFNSMGFESTILDKEDTI